MAKSVEVTIVTRHVYCNVKGCKNYAEFSFYTGTSHALDLYLCIPCVNAMRKQIAWYESLRAEHPNGSSNGNGNVSWKDIHPLRNDLY